MKRNKIFKLIPILIVSMTGCASSVIMNSDGPTNRNKHGQTLDFENAYNASNKKEATLKDHNLFLQTGLSLIDNNCDEYFDSEGDLQKVLTVTKDVINTLGPIASGALALGKSSTDAIAIITLSMSGTNSIISTVAKDFLFDAANIQDIKTLVKQDLGAHAIQINSTLSNNPGAITFNWVTNQLTDHQGHCTDPYILSLVKQAITSGKVETYIQGQPSQQGKPVVQPAQPAQQSQPNQFDEIVDLNFGKPGASALPPHIGTRIAK